MPTNLLTQEQEIRRSNVQSQPEQINRPYLEKIHHTCTKKGLMAQSVSDEFKLQKKKKKQKTRERQH
jgi:hypothetical protein